MIGLIAIALTYVTHSLYFLALAVIAFFVGLVLMGAIRRPQTKVEEKRNNNRKQRR